ncbi:hypothetical protein DQ237_04715 [Blastococcus sp. TF02-8]|nr:hypothetical protein DQ237_04715 [Blastococcus sp. TF02-8]
MSSKRCELEVAEPVVIDEQEQQRPGGAGLENDAAVPLARRRAGAIGQLDGRARPAVAAVPSARVRHLLQPAVAVLTRDDDVAVRRDAARDQRDESGLLPRGQRARHRLRHGRIHADIFAYQPISQGQPSSPRMAIGLCVSRAAIPLCASRTAIPLRAPRATVRLMSFTDRSLTGARFQFEARRSILRRVAAAAMEVPDTRPGN